MHGRRGQPVPEHSNPAPFALAACLALGTALTLAACSTPQARFSTIADLPPDLLSAVLIRDAGQTDEGERLFRIDIDQRFEGDLPERPLLIPFSDERPWARPGDRGRPIVDMTLWPLLGSHPHTMRAVVDTGAASTLILSRDAARDADVWISAEIGPHEGIGFVGPVPAGEGLVRRLQVGPLTLAPSEAKVNTAQDGVSAALGLSAFMAFGGLVFDWQNHVIIALPRGKPVHVDPAWVEVAWGPVPTARLEPWFPQRAQAHTPDAHDSLEDPAPTAWSMHTQFRGTPVVQAAVAGESLRIVLDTGGDGHLASLRPLAVEGRGRARQVASHGRVQAMREHTLAGDVRIGPIVFPRPIVVVPDPRQEAQGLYSDASMQYFDAVFGVELLRQHPVWFDFERGVARFWNSDAPLPALTTSRSFAGP